jgi:response regulator NasT
MDILLVTDRVRDDHPLEQAAVSASCRVLKQIETDQDITRVVEKLQPDALVIDSNNLGRNIRDELTRLKNTAPLPVLVFTHDGSAEAIQAAVKMGVTSYIVDCSDMNRLKALLDVAAIRFKEQSRLQSELDDTRQALQDRKVIDKAKGILMKQRKMTEDDAYRALRKMAMDKNKRIGDIAEQLVQIADMLV